jgi:carbon storage regulator CsrA
MVKRGGTPNSVSNFGRECLAHLLTAFTSKEVVRMLVLSRKIGEKIHVGENISIEVRRVAGNRVTLAIEAPKEIRILRGELKAATESFEEPISLDAVAHQPVEGYSVTHHRVSVPESMCYTI